MCVECEDLQKQIVRYRLIQNRRFDVFTAKRIKELIQDLELRKGALHEKTRSATSPVVTIAK
jgi:hypothetical protein